MSWWSVLGSWIVLGMSLAALIFSVLCFHMIRTSLQIDLRILNHILQFDPTYPKVKEIVEKAMDENCNP